jgi:hypothetical protein
LRFWEQFMCFSGVKNSLNSCVFSLKSVKTVVKSSFFKIFWAFFYIESVFFGEESESFIRNIIFGAFLKYNMHISDHQDKRAWFIDSFLNPKIAKIALKITIFNIFGNFFYIKSVFFREESKSGIRIHVIISLYMLKSIYFHVT